MSHSRRRFLAAGATLATAAALGPLARAARGDSLTATPLAPGFTLIQGAGGNVVAMKGSDGSLLVDGGDARRSKALLAAAAKATGNGRVATLINTHWHPAQTGSNEAVGRAGGTIVSHEVTKLSLARAIRSVDYEGVYGPLAPAGRPTRTTRRDGTLEFGGRPVVYDYLPAAHTNGDLLVRFPDANLVVAGGPVMSEGWPLLDWRNGAWLGGLVRAHEKLAELVRGDTRVIPAEGAVLTGEDSKRQHELFAAFHEKMVGFQNKGMDTGDILAERPLKDYEAQYGDPTEFIRGAFRSLNIAYSPD